MVRDTPLPHVNNDLGAVIRVLNTRIREEELIVTKADKGNAVAVMERSSYLDKVYNVLESYGANKNEDFSLAKSKKLEGLSIIVALLSKMNR